MKTLILDYSKWRCGGGGNNELGKGTTSLHNSQGYECCLGQFSRQLNNKLDVSEIREKADPGFVFERIPFLNRKTSEGGMDCTTLSYKAININDDPFTTASQKIFQLRKLFKKKGFIIRVINRFK